MSKSKGSHRRIKTKKQGRTRALREGRMVDTSLPSIDSTNEIFAGSTLLDSHESVLQNELEGLLGQQQSALRNMAEMHSTGKPSVEYNNDIVTDTSITYEQVRDVVKAAEKV